MRRMILTTLVLLPVMAQAQARTSTEPQPLTSSAALLAETTKPAATTELAMATVPAEATPTSIPTINMPTHAAVREVVQTRMTENFADAALRKGGSLEYAMLGSIPTESSAPRVTRAVEVDLSPAELAEQPTVSNIVVHATVDANGLPRDLMITKSAGSVVDRKVLAAVGQYRFSPATMDNRPVDAAVTISIKIQKP